MLLRLRPLGLGGCRLLRWHDLLLLLLLLVLVLLLLLLLLLLLPKAEVLQVAQSVDGRQFGLLQALPFRRHTCPLRLHVDLLLSTDQFDEKKNGIQ